MNRDALRRALRIGRLVVLLLLPSVQAAAQASQDAGEHLYAVCAGCHGFVGEGNPLVGAPALAGLEPWYVARQMQNLAAGVRGMPGDDNGQRMAVMAGAVRSERDLDDVVAYIATLPGERMPARIEGDLEAGRRQFAVCAACHGPAGEGNEAIMAPALAPLDDWYLVEQLRLFAGGLRGANPNDTYGQQMRALAPNFSDDAARRNIAVYVRSLRK